MRIYNLTDGLEQSDDVTLLYREFVLYLVSNAFERTQRRESMPVLGMTKFENNIVPDGNLEIIYSGVGLRCAATANHTVVLIVTCATF